MDDIFLNVELLLCCCACRETYEESINNNNNYSNRENLLIPVRNKELDKKTSVLIEIK